MPAFLLPLLLKLPAIRAWIKAHAILLVMGVLALVMCGSAIFLYERGRGAGQKEVEVRVEQQHTETIREVRNDEQVAQKVTDAIAARLDAVQDQQRATAAQTTKDIDNAFKAIPPLAPGVVDRVAPDSVRASSNSLVDRANRAADYTGPAD